MKKVMVIEGMSCNHCKKAVESALLKVVGVKNVEVHLELKQALVDGDNLSEAELKAAIDEIGYQVKSIQ